MPDYAEMAKILLEKKNPHELARLKEEGILEEVLREVQETFSQEEADIVREICRKTCRTWKECRR